MKFYNIICAGLLGGLLLATPVFVGCGDKNGADTEEAADANAADDNDADAAVTTAGDGDMDEAVEEVTDAINDITDVIKKVETPEDVDKHRGELEDLGKRMESFQTKYAHLQNDTSSAEDLNAKYPEMQKAFGDMMKAMIDLGMKSPEAAEKLGKVIEEVMPEDAAAGAAQ